MGLFSGLGGSLLSAGTSLIGGFMSGKGQEDANAANAQMAQRQMDFQERMSSTSYQRAVEDMKKAGLNPMLAYSQGGASSPGGSTAVLGNKGAAQAAGAAAAAQVTNTNAQTSLLDAQRSKTEAEKSLVEAQTLQSTASAGHTNVMADKVKQDMRKFEDEWDLLKNEVKFMGNKAGRESLQFSHDIRSFDPRLDSITSEAAKLKHQAELLGLDVPEAVAHAAFWKSPVGKARPYIDTGTSVLGSVTGSAAAAGRAYRSFGR